MKRLGAIVAAAVLVGAAFLLRGIVTGDGSSSPIAGGSNGGSRATTVLCPTEFATICSGLSGASSSGTAGSKADALTDATSLDDLGAGAWIVPRSWAELVIDERARLRKTPLFEIDDEPLASTGVVLAVWADRHDQLLGSCAEVDWRCLAEKDGQQLSAGDRVAAGIGPVDSATGLPLAAAQAASLLGASDFAANDFDAEFRTLAQRLAAHPGDDPLGRMRARGPGELTAAGVPVAEAGNLSSNFGEIRSVDIEPAVRIDVVALIPAGGGLDGDARKALTEAFQAAGWDAAPADPADDGLPAGGVLAAVRTLWNS